MRVSRMYPLVPRVQTFSDDSQHKRYICSTVTYNKAVREALNEVSICCGPNPKVRETFSSLIIHDHASTRSRWYWYLKTRSDFNKQRKFSQYIIRKMHNATRALNLKSCGLYSPVANWILWMIRSLGSGSYCKFERWYLTWLCPGRGLVAFQYCHRALSTSGVGMARSATCIACTFKLWVLGLI